MTADPAKERPVVTTPEYAQIHNVTVVTVKAWIAEGRLPGAYQSPPDTPRGTWLIFRETPRPTEPNNRGRPRKAK